MKILSVELTNFGPFYGTHVFNLSDRGLLLVMGDNLDEARMDSNGSGKSSIFNGLDWCLWGENPTGDHAEAMFNEEAFAVRGSTSGVRVLLVNDIGEEIEIGRFRTKSKNELSLTVGGRGKETLDTKETQVEIEQLLGMDREVFHAAVLFGQTDMVHYADAKDALRMEILTKILQLDDLDLYLERVKVTVKRSTERVLRIRTDLVAIEGQLQGTRPEDLDAQIVQWDQEQQATLARLQEQLNTKATEHRQVQGEIQNPTVLQARKAVLDQELAVPAPGESPEYQQADRNVRQAQTDVAMAAQPIRDIQARLDHMQSLGEGTCSECGQLVTGQHLQNEVQKLQGVLQHASGAVADAEVRCGDAGKCWAVAKQQDEALHEVYRAAREERLQESARIDADLRILAGHQARVDALVREMEAIQADLAARQEAVNPWVARRTQLQNERYELERRQGQIQYELDTSAAGIHYLEFWIQGLGARGLKSYILDNRLQELSDAANEWLSWLTGGTIWVRFEAQKQTRGKKLINAPDVRVFRWNPDGTTTERGYKSWSGGEKQRISFCIDFGLSRLVARRAAKTYDLLILDEVFKHLDRSGKEAVMEMLQALAQEKSSLIVVEHDTEFQGQFERRVIVKKQNRRSTIQEIDDGEKAAQEGVSLPLQADSNSKRVIARIPVRRPVS